MFKKGGVPWNKGITKENFPQLAHSKEAKQKMSKNKKGKKFSKEWCKNISKAKLGEKNPNYGKHCIHSKETKEKIASKKRGMHHSEKAKKKMSETIARNGGRKGKNNPMYGKKHSDKTKKEISRIIKMRGWAKGENSNFWLGGISFEPYSIEFNKQLKELIRDRDKHICQLCGMPEVENLKKLSIHHIDYDKKNSLPSNLVSLCNSCHIKTNFNRSEWTVFLIDKINNNNEIKRIKERIIK